MRKKKSRKRLKGAGLIGLIVIVALVIVSLVYVSNYYHVQDRQAALESTDDVKVEESKNLIKAGFLTERERRKP